MVGFTTNLFFQLECDMIAYVNFKGEKYFGIRIEYRKVKSDELVSAYVYLHPEDCPFYG